MYFTFTWLRGNRILCWRVHIYVVNTCSDLCLGQHVSRHVLWLLEVTRTYTIDSGDPAYWHEIVCLHMISKSFPCAFVTSRNVTSGLYRSWGRAVHCLEFIIWPVNVYAVNIYRLHHDRYSHDYKSKTPDCRCTTTHNTGVLHRLLWVPSHFLQQAWRISDEIHQRCRPRGPHAVAVHRLSFKAIKV